MHLLAHVSYRQLLLLSSVVVLIVSTSHCHCVCCALLRRPGWCFAVMLTLCCAVQGLGKTLQSITFLAHLKWVMDVPGPHLVVVPLSVMSSWMSELARWVRLKHAARCTRHRTPYPVYCQYGLAVLCMP